MGEYDSTTGAWDKVAHLRCRSLSEFDHVPERLRGVRNTRTSLSGLPQMMGTRSVQIRALNCGNVVVGVGGSCYYRSCSAPTRPGLGSLSGWGQ